MEAKGTRDVAAAAGTDAGNRGVSPAATGVRDSATVASVSDAATPLLQAPPPHPQPTTETTTSATGEGKKTGRPAHPLWAHFHRGEKRNRYHYHAFCIYCVERYGANNVAPTRGVSIDMLRHLEKCTLCPRSVVETVKDICGRRDALRFDRYGKKKQQGDAATTTSTTVASLSQAGQLGAQVTAAIDASSGAAAPRRSHGPDGRSTSGESPKRPRLEATLPLETKFALIRLAVSAGLPAEIFQNADFHELLRYLWPTLADAPADAFSSMLEPQFLLETAQQLAAEQLDRVKEGMLNSTIKGGLTLSVHSWSTVDNQHLVAFNLVNSNGDSACIRVLDMGVRYTGNSEPYNSSHMALKIDEVLLRLEQQQITVVGIVADSMVTLNAARRVCMEKNSHRRSLLVVPCFARALSVLAGSVLTNAAFANTVSEVIEIASYFVNSKLLTILRAVSGDPQASFVLPNRENWVSFVDCVSRTRRYQAAIVTICQSSEYSVPHALKELVLQDEQAFWTYLEHLHAYLEPLFETYNVFFHHPRPIDHDKSQHDAEILGDDLAPTYGLTLAHVMYQLARMTQLYSNIAAISSLSPSYQQVAQMLIHHIDAMWRRYEMPAMVLSFVFNFHLDTALLDASRTPCAWSSIAQYFQLYYQRWFGPSSSTSHEPSIPYPVSNERIAEILDTFKRSQFPFDVETASDYVDVSSFYSFVADTHPEICALCCRMYAVSLLGANVSRFVRGIGFAPTATQTTRGPSAVELLLRVGFASSLRRRMPDTEVTKVTEGAMIHVPPQSIIWDGDNWSLFSEDWQLFVSKELDMAEFDMITRESAQDAASAVLAVKVPVQGLFIDSLPAMTVETQQGTHTMSTSEATITAEVVATNESTAEAAVGVISVGI